MHNYYCHSCETSCYTPICSCGCNCTNSCTSTCINIAEDGCPSTQFLECTQTQGVLSTNAIEITSADNGLEIINKLIEAITALQAVGATDKFIKISSTDTTANYGEDKIKKGTYVTITKMNPSLNEHLKIDVNIAALDTYIKTITLQNLDVISATGTSSWKIPRGTTAQRTTSPVGGMMRYNTSLNQIEGYIAGTINAWKKLNN